MYSSAIKKDINDKTQETATDIRDSARRIKGDVRDAADNVKHDLEDIARHAGEEARSFVGNAERSVVEATESVTTKIQENPIQSSMIALGVGFLLGLVFFRR